MTEPDAHPDADPIATSSAPPPPAADTPVHSPPPPGQSAAAPTLVERRWYRNEALPWLCALGFLVLAGAILFVGLSSGRWRMQPSSELRALADRVARLEQRAPPAQPADLGALEAQVAALEQRQPPDVSSLQAHVAALQARVAALQQQGADNSQLAARVDALSGQIAAAAGGDRSAETNLANRLDADEARLATLEQTTAATAARLNAAMSLARIEAAQMALAAGQPLGDLPNAPPAVTRFATANPPTDASLRLAFAHDAQAALAAGGPEAGDKPFLAGMLTRAEDLITVRQGDHVLLGNPVAGVLAHARTAVDAGDLAGAVAEVSLLSGPPAAAMAGWLADARALLAARAALAGMAAHG